MYFFRRFKINLRWRKVIEVQEGGGSALLYLGEVKDVNT